MTAVHIIELIKMKYMKRFFSLAGIALSILAASVLSSCEKDDPKDFDFTHTNWEAKVDRDAVSSLMISFMTADNGIIKEEFVDVDGANCILYSPFSYEVENGNGTLHIGGQYSFRNNKLVGKMLTGSDAHFALGKKSDILEFNDAEGLHDFMQTDFLPIPLPATNTPDDEESDVVLNYNLLKGNWINYMEMCATCSFNFYNEQGQPQPHIVDFTIKKYDLIRQKWWLANEETHLYFEIGTPANTVVFYDNPKDRNVMYHLVFHSYIEEEKAYEMSLYDASHNEIFYYYITKK